MTIKIRPLILPTLLIFQMCFIFIMSSFGHNSSDAQSNLFVDFIAQNFPHVRHGLENNLISLSTLIFLVRKTAHFTEYAILGALFYLNLIQFPKLNSHPKKLLLSILFSFLYAITDEIHQIFVPGRSAQLRDVLIDTLGASFGAIIIYLIIKLFSKIKTSSHKQLTTYQNPHIDH